MSASRASANAKLVQRHQRRSSSSGAKASGNKFTEKQSHFERRREEEHARSMMQASGNQALFDGSSSGRTASDALLGSRRESWRGTGAGVQAGSEEAPSPFAMHQQRKRSAQLPIGAGSTAMSTAAGSTFGMPIIAHATRSQRRTDRFNLSDKTPTRGGGGAGGGDAEDGTGLLGAAVAPWEAIERRGTEGGGQSEEPGHKRTREERFHDVVSSSKMHRAQLQRERTGREDETKALDKEIDGLLHLLTPRDKIKEEHDAFLRSGTPYVRHLLKVIKQKPGYEARQLRLRADGQFTVASLTTMTTDSEVVSTDGRTRQQKADVARYLQPPAASRKPADVADVLDEAGKKLLAKIRKGKPAPEEMDSAAAEVLNEEEEAELALNSGDDDDDQDVLPPAEEDDFDKMLNLMSLDPRRARATDRTLDEAELAELEAQQALLEADRSAIPSLGLAEKDQHMLTRTEWMEQGGDRAFHMDAEEAGEADVYGDNVDIPSSYEGDSDAEDEDADEEAEAAATTTTTGKAHAEGEGPSLSSSSSPTASLLDRLMAELEHIANSSVPETAASTSGAEARSQRRQHLHKVVTQLHSYAGHHVLQVAELFRLVLIEAQRSFLRNKRGTLSRSLLLHLYVITKLFPMSDYRHEVTTPFLLFLCSTLLQARLETLRDVHGYLVLAGLLFTSMRHGSRFCAELLVAPLNVLLLQIPKSLVEPAKYQGLKVPIPLIDRCEAPLLGTTSPSRTDAPAAKAEDPTGVSGATRAAVDLLHEGDLTSEPLLLAAYRLLTDIVDLYTHVAALPAAVLEPFRFFEQLLLSKDARTGWEWTPTPAVRAAHTALTTTLNEAVAKIEDQRTPLAMRYFRPRPLRLFEPLLAEQESNAVKTEIRSMKREIREDKKRVMRHLTAEATVTRRAKEKEASLEDAQREKRYNQVLGQLQAQQHTMKTVDAMMSKAKSKQKKGISGMPTAPGAGGGGGSGDAE